MNRLAATVMNVTERKQTEQALEDARAELARMARLATMSNLAASICHEISQPLAAIVTNAEASLRWLGRDAAGLGEARDAIASIVSDGHRVADIIRGLRALASKSELTLAELDIDDAIQEVLPLTRGMRHRHRVLLRTRLAATDRPVVGDRVQLQQVVLNLIMNGIEAMTTVRDRPRVLTISSQPGDPSGVIIAVEDTGTGLDQLLADRIFDPLFTTKRDGMGMGLWICRSIIEAHGGRLWASPRLPHGTAFHFMLPAAAR
jgi:C4-dicarboxylate-specific signal transduction histidine kinase